MFRVFFFLLTGMYCCGVCGAFASPTFAVVLRHIGYTHAGDEQLALICPVPGCPRQNPYSKFESFRSHMYRKHRDVLERRSCLDRDRSDGSSGPQGPTEHTSAEEDIGDVDELGSEEGYFCPVRRQPSDVNLQHAAAHFLLKTREERKITQSAVDGIVQDLTDLWDKGMKEVRNTKGCTEKAHTICSCLCVMGGYRNSNIM